MLAAGELARRNCEEWCFALRARFTTWTPVLRYAEEPGFSGVRPGSSRISQVFLFSRQELTAKTRRREERREEEKPELNSSRLSSQLRAFAVNSILVVAQATLRCTSEPALSRIFSFHFSTHRRKNILDSQNHQIYSAPQFSHILGLRGFLRRLAMKHPRSFRIAAAVLAGLAAASIATPVHGPTLTPG